MQRKATDTLLSCRRRLTETQLHTEFSDDVAEGGREREAKRKGRSRVNEATELSLFIFYYFLIAYEQVGICTVRTRRI